MDSELLQEISKLIAPIVEGQNRLFDGQEVLRQNQTELLDGQKALEERQTKLQIAMENDIAQKLSLLLEGQQGMNQQLQKLDKLTKDFEAVKEDLYAIRETVSTNAEDIVKLKRVK